MRFFQNLPIQRKVGLVILLTCGTALGVTAAAIFLAQLVTFRQNFTRDLEAIGQIIGDHSTAALTFKDRKAAEEILGAVKAKPHILQARIDLPDGSVFAEFQRARQTVAPVAPQGDGFHFTDRYLVLNRPIVLARERIGTLHLVSDYRAEYGRSLRLYADIIGAVLLVSILLALVLSERLQRLIAAPILGLAQTAQDVADRKDYSLRAQKTGHDEVGRLTDAFNGMLAKIESHDGTLRQTNQTLEREIAERKRTETELAYQRDLLKTLLDSLPDAIYFKDRESRFVHYSKSFARHFHLADPEMLRGKTDADFFTEEHARPALEDEREIIRTRKPIIGKVEKETHADGRITWALTSKMPWSDKDGNVIGTFGISKDLTALKDAEQEVEILHKQLMLASRQAGMAEVATGVLHNVGNVLNSVNVSTTLINDYLSHSAVSTLVKVAGLLQEHVADTGTFLTADPKGKLVPDFIIQLAQHLDEEHTVLQKEHEQLVRNVEHIKEIVAMQQSYANVSGVLETVSLPDLIEDALRFHTAGLDRHGVRIVRQYAVVPRLTLDKHKVLQILVNLVHNAKYALDDLELPDRQLTVGISLNGDNRVKVVVADNGVGIPPDNLTRIFSLGFTTRKGGHGFGLHSSANAAKEMGGTLKAQSGGPGKGATFTLELPLAGQTGAI